MKNKIFTIKKGLNRSRWLPSFTTQRNLIINFTLLDDFEYESSDDNINSLYGFSDGLYHKTNSIQFGWRWVKDKGVELLAEFYSNGINDYRSLGFIKTNEEHSATIQIHKKKYIVIVNGRVTVITRGSKWCLLRYRLFPSFNSSNGAPKNFKIQINEK